MCVFLYLRGINLKTRIMKKIVLFVLLVSSFDVNAQFWFEKATAFVNPGRTLNSISIVDSNVIWANEYDSVNQDFTLKGFTRSTDGGNTWTSGTITLTEDIAFNLGVSSITAVSATTAWVAVHPETFTVDGGIWKTTDAGVIWTKQTTALFNGVDSYANFVHFWDENNGIAQGDPESGEFEIYTTTDGGTTWTQVPGTNIPDPDIAGEYGYFNRYTVSGNTIWFGTDKGRIFKSSDKGLTWTVSNSVYSTDFGLDRFTFSDTNKGLLLIYDNTSPTLYSTTDGGSSWNIVATTMPASTDIAYIPGTSTAVCGNSAGTALLGSSYTLDNGLTWINIDTVPHGLMAFLSDSFGFSAGINTNATTGGISKFTGIPLKKPSFDSSKQIAAYPNPTNGMLYLNSENSLIKEASVFDLLGKQVYKSNFSALNNVNLDLKSLQTGAYLLKVTSDSGKTETIKIMKN